MSLFRKFKTALINTDTISICDSTDFNSNRSKEILFSDFIESVKLATVTPHIALLDTTTQTITVANTPQLITFNTLGFSNKIAKTSSSRFTVEESGQYLANLSAQTQLIGGANNTLNIWFKVNGANLTNSNSKVKIVNSNDQKRLTITIPFVLNANDYIELWMSGDDIRLELLASPSTASPDIPLTPSLFLTIDRLP